MSRIPQTHFLQELHYPIRISDGEARTQPWHPSSNQNADEGAVLQYRALTGRTIGEFTLIRLCARRLEAAKHLLQRERELRLPDRLRSVHQVPRPRRPPSRPQATWPLYRQLPVLVVEYVSRLQQVSTRRLWVGVLHPALLAHKDAPMDAFT